ncbi:MAG: ATP-binding cassette domain-containing protein, partial [Gemmatimonadetes bacterium]|nr:ATP-binding cassette domain-containing protein [Gemmatimonadota bacterium]
MTTTDNTPYLETLPPDVALRLDELTTPAETSLIQVATDMEGRDLFGESWVVVTDRQLLLLPGNSGGSDEVTCVDLKQVRKAKAEPLVGGGRLDVERRDGATATVYYSNTLAPKFAEVAESLKQLAAGDTPELPTQIERTRCERCDRILPEKDGVCPACLRKLDTLGRLLRYMCKYRWRMAGLLSILVLETVADLIPPIITQYLIDDVLIDEVPPMAARLSLLGWLVGGLLGVSVLQWVTWVSRRWIGTWIGFRAIEQLRADLYRALQYLPLRFYDKRRVGALISRMSNDSDLVEIYLIFDMPYVINNFLMVVFILSYLFWMSWELTLWVLVPVPPIIIGSMMIWKRMEAYWQRWSAKWSRLSSHLNESIRGIRIVKAFAQEPRESQRFDRRNAELRDVSVAAERTWVVFWMVTNFLMSFGVFFVWYFGGQQVLGQELTPGELMAFITFIWMLYQPLKWFGDFYGFMMRAYAGAERIFEVIDARPEPFDKPDATPMPHIEGAVEFDGAFFGYDPGKPVLKDADLAVKPGEMIGLVGRSGAGKSTLIHMICRFYDTTRGQLRIDGTDIRDIRLEDLRS